jgi:NAD(P)-dependent dehydrogenase (short-subunit alcohol dehydrogenase family)
LNVAPAFANKVEVITGGSSGIGLATAKRFASEGAQVFITGRRREELDKAVSAIGPNAIGVAAAIPRRSSLDYRTSPDRFGS